MSRIQSIAVAIILALWCPTAFSMTGEQLAAICGVTKNANTTELATCLGYINGAIDQAGWDKVVTVAVNRKIFEESLEKRQLDELNRSLAKRDPTLAEKEQEAAQDAEIDRQQMRLYCPPDGATTQQTVAVISKFLRDTPARWQWPAAPLVIEALQAAFPCK